MKKIDKSVLNAILKDTKKYKVLYVEDHEEVRKETLSLLHNYFDHITVAINGEDGYNKFLESDFDIIFTDLDMPVMDGIEMIKKIRESNLLISIVVLSAYDDKEYILEALNEGIDGYILKPYTMEKIVNLLKRVVFVLSSTEQDDAIELANGFSFSGSKNLLKDKNHEIVKLTIKELELVKFLIENKEIYMTSEIIIANLYGEGDLNSTKIRSIISRIHKKTQVNIIESHYGMGYKIRTKK